MAEMTQSDEQVTTLASQNKIISVDVDGAAGTEGSVTFANLSVVIAVLGAVLIESPTADCCGVGMAKPNATTTNQVDVILKEGDGTPCTQNPLDYRLTVIGY